MLVPPSQREIAEAVLTAAIEERERPWPRFTADLKDPAEVIAVACWAPVLWC
jgi:hypothetical protein